MTTFLDSDVVISLLNNREHRHDWAVDELNRRKAVGPAIISDIVYCEVSMGMNTKEELDKAILLLGLDRFSCKDEALFRAGKAFLKYKKENKGPKLGVVPDFIIGAIADSERVPLMTLNTKDYVNYFPDIEFITPA